MAYTAGDWSITRSTGVIDYIGADHGGAPTYSTGLDAHRNWQQLAASLTSSGDDQLDITDLNPTSRNTDNDFVVINGYTLTDAAIEHLYDATFLQQVDGTRWDAVRNFGSATTQIQIIQDGAVLADDFWNQAGAGLNADAGQNISHRFLIKTIDQGADIDGRRLIGIHREFGDSYEEFSINGTSAGINVLALNPGSDGNNLTAAGTVATWDQFDNNNEGYITLDIDGNGTPEPYFSELRFNIGGTTPATADINDAYEFWKYETRAGTASNLYGISGELFRGITHEIGYDGEAGTGPVELEGVYWGTTFDYNNELASGLTVGEYYTFGTSGAIGKLLALDDNGTTGTVVFAIQPGTGTVVNTESFTRVDGTATDGADVNSVPDNTAAGGGYGIVLADNTTDTIWIQLLSGVAPVDNLELYFGTLSTGVYDPANTANATATINSYQPSTPFIGSSTGSAINPGGYGVGWRTTDMGQNDRPVDLDGNTITPPNQVTFSVNGLISTEDTVHVAPYDGSTLDANGDPALEKDQLTLSTSLLGATETAVVVTTAIPSDTPATGTIRVQLDDGRYWQQAYTSWTGSTFTIASADYSVATGNGGATNPRNVYISYIDKVAAAATESFTVTYNAARDLVVLVRDGGAVNNTPIKQYIATAVLGSAGGSSTANRTSDA